MKRPPSTGADRELAGSGAGLYGLRPHPWSGFSGDFPGIHMADHLRTLEWNWVALAIAFEVAVYFADAWRWGALMKPGRGELPHSACACKLSWSALRQTILFRRRRETRAAASSFPMRARFRSSLAITSDVILRVMDGVWIVLLYLAVTLGIWDTHGHPRRECRFSESVRCMLAALVLFVLFRRQHAHHFVRTTSWAARLVPSALTRSTGSTAG